MAMAEIEKNKKDVSRQLYTGTVVSQAMQKTVTVKVERTYKHPVFHKTVRTFKTYKVHDEESQARLDDIVEFYEGRPRSKTKYMYLHRVVKAAPVRK